MRLWEKQKNRKNLAEKLGCQSLEISMAEDQIKTRKVSNIHIVTGIYNFATSIFFCTKIVNLPSIN